MFKTIAASPTKGKISKSKKASIANFCKQNVVMTSSTDLSSIRTMKILRESRYTANANLPKH